MEDYWLTMVAIGGATAGGVAAWALGRRRERKLRASLEAGRKDFEDKLSRESAAAAVSAKLAAQEQLAADRLEAERAWAKRLEGAEAQDRRLLEREQAADRQFDRVVGLESELKVQAAANAADRARNEAERTEVERLKAAAREKLEQTAGLDADSARATLLGDIERESAKDAADLSRHILERARTQAETEARRVLATALQRYAGVHTFESTTATVALSGEEMKGRIIGREGRNIRAFEAVTGVTVLVDDTPNAVVLSAFDPVRREIARQAMERLILDGRIHPARIEEVVAAATAEMEAAIQKAGEDAVFRAGTTPVTPETARLLGKLRFRHSYAQNVLDHSVEVAHLAGLMASEIGADPGAARRCGLLHDIGKALSHEIEGPHALVGADFLKRQGESPIIVDGVASHHDEVPHETLFGILVSAADAISASRPGARSESMTTYLKRLENLERVAMSFDGVERAFAVQAGRELRVVVRPEQVGDAEAALLARRLVRQIEEELLYPGQIRVTVVRETRCVEFAK